jgi:carbonic anhydrase
MKAILEGLQAFQGQVFARHQALFEKLFHNQEPKAAFITCSDSRVVPNLLLQAEPGELFVIRNAGNIVPAAGQGGEGVVASIEYAVEALGVTDVILCGHTNCGAMKGILHPEKVASMPQVAEWVRHGEPARQAVERLYPDAAEHELMERLVEQNVIQQVKNLLTHDFIRSRVHKGGFELYGWVYDILTGAIKGLDESGEAFAEISFEAPGSPDEAKMLLELENPR